MARTDTEENKQINGTRGNQGDLLMQAESIRPKHHHHAKCDEEKPAKSMSEAGMSTFWRVFGGTIFSIIALICITICNQFSASLSDLRRDINAQVESRSDFVKKADLDRAVATLWSGLEETRVSANALDNLTDKAKTLEQQLDRQAKSTGDDRKELTTRIEDNRKSTQEESRETAKKVEELRKVIDDERKEYQRKLEEQRKASDDDRKDMTRKFEEKQKWFEEQHKELTGKLQALAERLAAVESVQNQGKTISVPAIGSGAKKN